MIELYKEFIKEAYFTQNIVLLKTAIMWKCAAIIRIQQDAKCSINPSAIAIAESVFFMTLASTMTTEEDHAKCLAFERNAYAIGLEDLFLSS